MQALPNPRWICRSLAVVALCLTSGWSSATTVRNFRLTDHRGNSHELHYYSDLKAVVLMAYANDCKPGREAALSLERLRVKHEPRGVVFFLIDATVEDTRTAIAESVARAGISMPVLSDTSGLIAQDLGLDTNGQLVVIDPRHWSVIYRGAVASSGRELLDLALDSLANGTAVIEPSSRVVGCSLAPSAKGVGFASGISYSRDIAPLLMDKCAECHREGSVAPWAMSSHAVVQGFAPMIEEVLRTGRMPPWHADREYGAFLNDRSLSVEQMKTLVSWIRSGAPKDGIHDPLAAVPKQASTWTLGEPDLIVTAPDFDVEATGTIPYRIVKVRTSLDHDVWLRAVDYLPGERSVLHHVLATAGNDFFGTISLHNYSPGGGPLMMPAETGIFLPKNSTVHFQFHYTPNGKQVRDRTQLGLYFMKGAPKYSLRSLSFANPLIKIPPQSKSHSESMEQVLEQDVIIYSLYPHAHYRGKAASFVASYPDGTTETLLNVPNYSFSWQTTYELRHPKLVPAKTRILYTMIYDNSTQNLANPDSNALVRWGEQSSEEMMFATIRYRNTKEDAAIGKDACCESHSILRPSGTLQ